VRWLPVICFCGCLLRAQEISPAAKAYLDSALDVKQEHFLHKDKIDWAQLRRATLAQAAAAETTVDTYPAIRFALAKLDDHHSYLQPTPELSRTESQRQPKLADPAAMPKPPARKQTFPYPSPFRTRRVPESAMVPGVGAPIAQVVVPMFASPERKDLDDYATKVQDAIAAAAANRPCGWIVDLRGNGGGNIWAMMAGVGPLLGEGEPGAMLGDGGSKVKWFYEEGRAGMRGTKEPEFAKSTQGPVKLEGTRPVAVLIDRDTGSSGEGIAIAFRGRPDTRFFGELTYGAATSTFPYKLSDGAQIYLVTGVMLDRNGHEYRDGIAPDEEVRSMATITSNDPVIRAASEWLASGNSCRN
jgi:hypothetical protein